VTHLKNDTNDAGDLGRRIVERQKELDLSVAQVAERAGMALNYLEYLEQTPTAETSSSTLLRLALALDMDSSDLLGGQQGHAHGRTKAASDPHLVQLDDAECGNLLRGGGIGRVVFRASGRPVAIPVNYKMLKENVVFRSAGDGEINGLGPEEPVSFEVDCIDDAMSEGWSVLAAGTIHRVQPPAQLREVEALDIEPWAGGERNTYFCLRVTGLTGRKINAVR
jgi:nitroimidazol reductase NimA-like FMN-containing flavoprotein (pyridoxamine 5'-phosphate oxidase superfamily)